MATIYIGYFATGIYLYNQYNTIARALQPVSTSMHSYSFAIDPKICSDDYADKRDPIVDNHTVAFSRWRIQYCFCVMITPFFVEIEAREILCPICHRSGT